MKTGTLVSDPASNKKPYVNEPKNGFPLIGADNTGKCIKVKKSLSDSKLKEAADFEMEDFND